MVAKSDGPRRTFAVPHVRGKYVLLPPNYWPGRAARETSVPPILGTARVRSRLGLVSSLVRTKHDQGRNCPIGKGADGGRKPEGERTGQMNNITTSEYYFATKDGTRTLAAITHWGAWRGVRKS